MPASDTQESPKAPTKSRMATLQPEIMFEVADILSREGYLKKLPVISRLSLINKHWEAHMKLHPLFSTVKFVLARSPLGFSKRASFEDVKEWLMHPDRRHRLIQSFCIVFDNDTDYHALCDLLDNQLSDVKFNTFKLSAGDPFSRNGSNKEKLQFPRSLKARQLLAAHLERHQGFNWESLNNSLRNNLVSLAVFGEGFDPHNRNLAFKSLRKLDTGIVEDSDILRWNDFLRRHSSIYNLSIRGPYRPKIRLPLHIDSLDNLDTLELTDVTVDTESKDIQHIPLKSLIYLDYRHPIPNWTGLSNTLEKLVIESILKFLKDVDALEWDHDLLNPKMLHKLNNIKCFRLTGRNRFLKFAEAFDSGLYDNAMPLVEDLELSGPCVSEEALHRFIDEHKRLCRIDVWCKGVKYTGNPREPRAREYVEC